MKDEELWLEDDRKGYYYCPELLRDREEEEDGYCEFARFQNLVFDDWEIKQQEQFIDGLGNESMILNYDYQLDEFWYTPDGFPRRGHTK